MNSQYLEQLINEAQTRGGGIVLSLNSQPAAVVLSIEKYNELLINNETKMKENPQVQDVGSESLNKKVLVTGGAGYIGGHLVRELIKAEYEVTVLDNLSTGIISNLDAGAEFIQGDLADVNFLRDVFASHEFDAVFHMAASLEVEESVREPAKYLENNVTNTIKLLNVMAEFNVKKIIFSSTAAVYGQAGSEPVMETFPLHPNNPYGYSKLLAERSIKFFSEFMGFKAVVFRYFNACGFDVEANILPTHQSHLIYNVLQVAKGTREHLEVYGNDYETFDGTCIRDYVHVKDIVLPHILALQKLDGSKNFEVYNIGTGKGCSVLEVTTTASEVLNRIIPMQVASRRAGDAPITVADNTKLINILGYSPKFSDLENMIQTSWEVLRKI
jgi:UDP-glucose 4-epimerase